MGLLSVPDIVSGTVRKELFLRKEEGMRNSFTLSVLFIMLFLVLLFFAGPSTAHAQVPKPVSKIYWVD